METVKRFLPRILAMLLVTAVIMSAVVYTGKHGVRKDGLYYASAGIHPDCQIVTINGTAVSAEEYLYWLAYDCEYLAYYVSGIDWNAEISEGMTYGNYAKTDALETLKLYAIIRQWAAENGITLTAEDKAAIDAERSQYVAYYGSEEGYANQIKLLGVSEKAFKDINSVYYLYAHVYEQFCNPESKLYPGADALNAFGAQGNYMTIKEIFFSTTGLSDEEKTEKKAQAQSIADQLKAASNASAAFDTAGVISEDGIAQKNPNGLTFAPGTLDQTLETAVSALGENEVSGVIETTAGYYVAVRLALDPSGLLETYFAQQLKDARAAASVTYSKEYDRLDAGTFYTTLTEKRSDLIAAAGSGSTVLPGSDSAADSAG